MLLPRLKQCMRPQEKWDCGGPRRLKAAVVVQTRVVPSQWSKGPLQCGGQATFRDCDEDAPHEPFLDAGAWPQSIFKVRLVQMLHSKASSFSGLVSARNHAVSPSACASRPSRLFNAAARSLILQTRQDRTRSMQKPVACCHAFKRYLSGIRCS